MVTYEIVRLRDMKLSFGTKGLLTEYQTVTIYDS